MIEAEQISLQITSDEIAEKQAEFKGDDQIKEIRKRQKTSSPISKKQIEEMNDKVKEQILKNRKKYQKLISMNPYFSIKLYAPQNIFTIEQYNSSSIGLMMKQIDLLLEDAHILDKEINKAQLRKMQNERSDPNELDQWKNNYTCLRKIWLNINDSQSRNSMDKIQQLNLRVSTIKGNIYSMTKHQKQCYNWRSDDERYEDVIHKIKGLVSGTQEYALLKEKYEQKKMEFEDMLVKIDILKQGYEVKLEQKNKIIDKLKEDNEQLKKLLKESKQKTLTSQLKQSKLQFKIKQLEIELKSQSKKEVSVKESSDFAQTLQQIKDGSFSFLQNIKFKKVEKDPQQQAQNYQLDSAQKQLNPFTAHVGTKDYRERHSLPFFGLKQPIHPALNDEPQSKQLDQTCRGSDLSDVRSNDGKKSRFTRVRSPNFNNITFAKHKPIDETVLIRRSSEFNLPRMRSMRELLDPNCLRTNPERMLN